MEATLAQTELQSGSVSTASFSLNPKQRPDQPCEQTQTVHAPPQTPAGGHTAVGETHVCIARVNTESLHKWSFLFYGSDVGWLGGQVAGAGWMDVCVSVFTK